MSVAWGLLTGDTLGGALLLFGVAVLPVFVLRVHDTGRSADGANRDRIMADTIVKATDGAERVVAVVGGDHVDGVVSKLPDEFDLETRAPVYGTFSWQHTKEVAVPAVTAWSVLFVLYWIVVEVFRWRLVFR